MKPVATCNITPKPWLLHSKEDSKSQKEKKQRKPPKKLRKLLRKERNQLLTQLLKLYKHLCYYVKTNLNKE